MFFRCEGKKSSVPIVWLHDYHLMLAANTIRDSAVEEGFSIRYTLNLFYGKDSALGRH